MYVEPKSDIYLLSGCPNDPDYSNTLWFANQPSQESYFLSLHPIKFTEQYYTRPERGFLRIRVDREAINDCNYLMFRNPIMASGGTKMSRWYYAFITSVEYINNEVTEIRYFIDVLQTWMFVPGNSSVRGYEVGQCFVEREHTESDKIGENLLPEGVELGDHITVSSLLNAEHTRKIAVYTSVDDDLKPVKGRMVDGVYSGVEPKFYYESQINELNSYLEKLNKDAKADAVISINMVNEYTGSQLYQFPKERLYNSIPWKSKIKNNKMLTSPYIFLSAYNMGGNGAKYDIEYFASEPNKGSAQFHIIGTKHPDPSVVLIPQHYKKQDENYEESLEQRGFPQCAWNVDGYKAWLAQNSHIYNANFWSDTINDTLGGVTKFLEMGEAVDAGKGEASSFGRFLQSVGTLGTNIWRNLAVKSQKKLLPPQAGGHVDPSPWFAINEFTPKIYLKAIREEFALIIDNYFTMFGYACNRVKVPTLFKSPLSRPNHIYTKTVGCYLSKSEMPAEVEQQICTIFDSGVTFWMNPLTYRNYTVDNSPNGR